MGQLEGQGLYYEIWSVEPYRRSNLEMGRFERNSLKYQSTRLDELGDIAYEAKFDIQLEELENNTSPVVKMRADLA